MDLNNKSTTTLIRKIPPLHKKNQSSSTLENDEVNTELVQFQRPHGQATGLRVAGYYPQKPTARNIPKLKQ